MPRVTATCRLLLTATCHFSLPGECPVWDAGSITNPYCNTSQLAYKKDGCFKNLGRLIFSNDIFSWALVGHMLYQRNHPSHPSNNTQSWLCCLNSWTSQGWFSFHTTTLQPNATAFTSSFSLDRYFHHHTVKDGSLSSRIFTHLDDVAADKLKAKGAAAAAATGKRWDDRGFRLPSTDPLLIAKGFKGRRARDSYWYDVRWDDQTKGVPILPRIARCGCRV